MLVLPVLWYVHGAPVGLLILSVSMLLRLCINSAKSLDLPGGVLLVSGKLSAQ